MFLKTVLLSAVICLGLSLSSCKKNYNCVCRYEVLGVDEVTITEIEDVKRETARDECAENEDELRILFPDAECELE